MNDVSQLLELPKKRFFSNHTQLEHYVQSAETSHHNQFKLIEACQKHIAGEKPIKPETLKKQAMDWVSNYNYGKARGKIEKGVAENCATISNALSLGYCTFRLATDKDKKDSILSFLSDESKRANVASVLGMAFMSTFEKEPRLSSWLNRVEYPSYSFGYAALTYSQFDWMPSVVHPRHIAFPPETESENIESWVTYDKITATDLFEHWVTARNEKTRKLSEDESANKVAVNTNWNLDALEQVLVRAFRGKINNNLVETWAEVVPSYMGDATSVILETNDVKIAKIFYKELDGTLSEIYIPYGNAWANTHPNVVSSASTVNMILYVKNHGVFKQDEHINLIRDSGFTETGFIQDMRGIAKYAVEDSIRYNRNRNSANNKMVFAGSPMFERTNTQQAEAFKITVGQGFTMAPTGAYPLIDKQPTFDIVPHLRMIQFEEGEYLRDTQQYDATIQGRLSNRPNREEVQTVSNEIRVAKGAKNNIKLKDYSRVFQNIIKRFGTIRVRVGDPGFEGKKRFYDTVKKHLSWLTKTNQDVDKILSCIDSFVLDPIIDDKDALSLAYQMCETAHGRNRIKRMILVANGFPIEEVNIMCPLITDRFFNMGEDRVATIENDLLLNTNEVVFSLQDDHIKHLEIHFSKIDRIITAIQEGRLDIVAGYKHLANLLQHSVQHVDALSKDELLKPQFDQFLIQFQTFSRVAKKIESIAGQEVQRKQEEEGQIQIDPKVQAEIATDAAKAEADTRRKDWLAQERTKQRYRQIEIEREIKLARENQP
jgi:hypothetical protein